MRGTCSRTTTARRSRPYTYDYHNRLTSVKAGGTVVATYTYDALDRRIGVKDSGTQTWTVYDGQNPYADVNGSGTLLTRYVSGPALDELFARTSSGGTTAWYLKDRLGSVRDVVNTSGTVIDHVVYDSYGNITSETNASNGDRFKFTGMEWDAAIGQYYDHARWYKAGVGRYVSLDPLGFSSGVTNLYGYTSNAPTNMADPSGLQDSGDNYPQSSIEQTQDPQYQQAQIRAWEAEHDKLQKKSISAQHFAEQKQNRLDNLLLHMEDPGIGAELGLVDKIPGPLSPVNEVTVEARLKKALGGKQDLARRLTRAEFEAERAQRHFEALLRQADYAADMQAKWREIANGNQLPAIPNPNLPKDPSPKNKNPRL